MPDENLKDIFNILGGLFFFVVFVVSMVILAFSKPHSNSKNKLKDLIDLESHYSIQIHNSEKIERNQKLVSLLKDMLRLSSIFM